jgi:hypothetical protein
LNGPQEIAEHIWGDREKWRSVYRLPRKDFGIVLIAGQLTAYSGWVTAALARAAGGKRPRKAGA